MFKQRREHMHDTTSVSTKNNDNNHTTTAYFVPLACSSSHGQLRHGSQRSSAHPVLVRLFIVFAVPLP